jgi:hypothetical protein
MLLAVAFIAALSAVQPAGAFVSHAIIPMHVHSARWGGHSSLRAVRKRLYLGMMAPGKGQEEDRQPDKNGNQGKKQEWHWMEFFGNLPQLASAPDRAKDRAKAGASANGGAGKQDQAKPVTPNPTLRKANRTEGADKKSQLDEAWQVVVNAVSGSATDDLNTLVPDMYLIKDGDSAEDRSAVLRNIEAELKQALADRDAAATRIAQLEQNLAHLSESKLEREKDQEENDQASATDRSSARDNTSPAAIGPTMAIDSEPDGLPLGPGVPRVGRVLDVVGSAFQGLMGSSENADNTTQTMGDTANESGGDAQATFGVDDDVSTGKRENATMTVSETNFLDWLRETGLESKKAILGIESIGRCWYGDPRAMPKSVRTLLNVNAKETSAKQGGVPQGEDEDSEEEPTAIAADAGVLPDTFATFVRELYKSGVQVPTGEREFPPLPTLGVASMWEDIGESFFADGKDVTAEVVGLMRTDTRRNLSYVCLPDDFNSVFGDPSFGNEKVLVLEYRNNLGNNLTVVWSENGPSPRVWQNEDRAAVAQVVADSARGYSATRLPGLAGGGAGEEGVGIKAEGEETQSGSGVAEVPESGLGSQETQERQRKIGPEEAGVPRNAWLQQVLQLQTGDAGEIKGQMTAAKEGEFLSPAGEFASEDLFSTEMFSEEIGLSVDETEDENPPPPVIPFIKYASPGPPKSPWCLPDCDQKKFRILSLDGGGVRGVLAAVVLGRILKEVPSFLDNVDLIAGTSTGGLMALMLAAGYAPEEAEEIYKYACPVIFAKDPWRVYNPMKAKYSPKGRMEITKAYLNEDRTLGDLKKHVVITSFRLDGNVGPMGAFISRNGGWRPAVFSNIPKLDGKLEPDMELKAWDAAMRTSAAPTYFPSHEGYVDGAMFANNPAMLAVSKAIAHFPNVTPENTYVLSVGVGNFPISVETKEDLDWGIKDWVPYIFDLLMDGDSLMSELLLRYMLNSPSKHQNNPENRYHRIDATLPVYMELDDVSKIPLLVEIGQRLDLNDTVAFVRQHFSSTPSASDAFAQAALETASWVGETARKVQLNDVIDSLTAMPNFDLPNINFSSFAPPVPNISVPDIGNIASLLSGEEHDGDGEGGGDHDGHPSSAPSARHAPVGNGEGWSADLVANRHSGSEQARVETVAAREARAGVDTEGPIGQPAGVHQAPAVSEAGVHELGGSAGESRLDHSREEEMLDDLKLVFGAAARARPEAPQRQLRGAARRGNIPGKENVMVDRVGTDNSFRQVWGRLFDQGSDDRRETNGTRESDRPPHSQ